jgi:phosphate-selective porin OprO/OprP
MHGRVGKWAVPAAAAMVGWCLGTAAIAQWDVSPGPAVAPAYEVPPDPAYPVTNHPSSTMLGSRASSPGAYLASSHRFNADASLAERVAELEDELDKIKAKEAAAKEKAAGKPSVKVGGRIQVDWATFDQNPASILQADDMQNGTRFRRARMFISGDAFDVVDYKIQFDFAGQTDFKDVYITVKELPILGHVRVGHYKEPWSLEELTSDKHISFMEKGLPNGLVGGRSIGVTAFDYSEAETMTWAVGAFVSEIGETPPIFQDDRSGTAVTMRYTLLPWYDWATEGRGLLHTGICYSYRDIADEAVQWRARPEAHLANPVVDTLAQLDDVQNINAICAETAFVYGPFSAQAEYFGYWLDRASNPHANFNGMYAYVSYFLTGENRYYKRTAGCFDRVKPFENFFRVRAQDGNVHTGKGAWEVLYRYSYLDLNDTVVVGGRVGDHTFGLNWYLNPYTRLMWNYVHSETNAHPVAGGTGVANIFEMRCQIDF